MFKTISIISLIATVACSGVAPHVNDASIKVCCCASSIHSTIGATSESDCEGPCKASDKMNVKWELIDGVNTWDEYNDSFDANVEQCKALTGV